MRSIVYAGNDFSDVCSAEVVARSANPIIAEYMRVPGRAGALLVTGYIPPVDVTVRLFMDMGYNPGFTGMAQMRAKVRRWLSWPGGGNLILPDDPEIEYRDAILVGAADWSNLFEDGECQLTFTLFDPIGWGAERVERTARFDVGGNWPTLPEIRLVAAAGSYLQVSVPSIGRGIRVDYGFSGGEAVVVDCQGETVRINDVDARDCVALASDFFALDPGEVILSTSNCTYVETRFSERWAWWRAWCPRSTGSTAGTSASGFFASWASSCTPRSSTARTRSSSAATRCLPRATGFCGSTARPGASTWL